jgi:large subunit ribosomal protein L36
MVAVSTTCRGRLDGPKGQCTMKARNSLRALKQKAGSVVVRRGRRVFVLNKRNPRWNARQG